MVTTTNTIEEILAVDPPDFGPLVVCAVEYPSPVGKAFCMLDGALKKTPLDRPPEGAAIHREYNTFKEFAAWRRGLLSSTLLTSGAFVGSDVDGVAVLFKHCAGSVVGAISLTKEHLMHRPQAGIIIIDIDVKSSAEVQGLYRQSQRDYAVPEDALPDLNKILPEAKACALLVGGSTSAEIHSADGEQLTPPGGIRIYIPVTDASKIPQLLEIMHKRSWCHGLGWAFISGGASLQERSFVDLALSRPTQVDYAAPDLNDDLTQDRKWVEYDGDWLDPNTVTLTPEDEAGYRTAVAEARRALKPDLEVAKKAKIDREVDKAVANGSDPVRARKNAMRRLDSAALYPTDIINFDDGSEISGLELLTNGETFDGQPCRDPDEPDYDGGRNVGIFYWNDGDRPGVHSYAHGSRWYVLCHDVTSLEAIIEMGSKDAMVAAMARTEFADSLETVAAEKAIAKQLSLGNQRAAIRDAVEKEKSRLAGHDDEAGDRTNAALIKEGRWPLDKPLPTMSFPFHDGNDNLLDHQDNLDYMLQSYGISIKYNVVSKSLKWTAPSLSSDTDNADNALFSLIKSLASLNGLPNGNDSINVHFPAVAERRQINPVRDYLADLKWDGVDRVRKLAEELGAHDIEVADVAIFLWFVQACAAADGAEIARQRDANTRPVYEQVLVQVGVQGIGKTKGLLNIVPKSLHSYVRGSVVLNTSNKDQIKIAVSCWIAELGELDATFRAADHVAFKAFMSRELDELRMPYAHAHSQYRRRTVFFGSVNEDEFLKDKTGARRFLPLAVDRGFPAWSEAEVDQLWAQAWAAYIDGELWWPTPGEERLLADNAEAFRQRSWEEERLEEEFDWGTQPDSLKRMTATDLWDLIIRNYRGGTARPMELGNVAKAMARLWREHGAKQENGRLVLDTPGGVVHVKAEGGKNRGWLVPGVKGLGISSVPPGPPNQWPAGIASANNNPEEGGGDGE